MHLPTITAAQPPITLPIASAPLWPLRSPTEELRAVIMASRARIGLAHARAIIDVQAASRGRRA